MPELRRSASRIVEALKERSEEAVDAAAGGPARFYVGLLLGAVYGLDAADKAALAAIAGSIEKAFNIGNLDFGLLIAAVSFTGAVFTLPVGALADRINRRRILLVAVAIWTAAMVVSGTSTSFTYLLITRLFLGGVTAAASPTIASLVGDFFPPQARGRIYGVVLSSELIGTGVGFFIAGEVSSYVDWRWALYLMALPSAFAFWVIWRFLPEPARGGQSWIRLGQEELPEDESGTDHRETTERQHKPAPEASRTDGDGSAQTREIVRRAGIKPRRDLILHQDPTDWSLWHAIRYMLRIPTYALLIIASSLGYYFFAGARTFGMIYLTHHYHMSRSTVTALAVIVGVGGLAGLFLGTKVAERLLARGWVSARIVVPGTSLFIAAVLIGPAIWITNPFAGIALFALGTAALAGANPPIDTARLDIVPFRLWGRGESGRMALRGLLEGGAPLLFGAMSDWLGGGTSGLEWTFLIMLIPVFVASSLAIPARRTYPRDVATADASMRRIKRQRA
ncbi:MAG: MFS transporter [Xanthobacteraceae bacterium]